MYQAHIAPVMMFGDAVAFNAPLSVSPQIGGETQPIYCGEKEVAPVDPH